MLQMSPSQQDEHVWVWDQSVSELEIIIDLCFGEGGLGGAVPSHPVAAVGDLGASGE